MQHVVDLLPVLGLVVSISKCSRAALVMGGRFDGFVMLLVGNIFEVMGAVGRNRGPSFGSVTVADKLGLR